MTFSVVIPTYNGEKYIEQAVLSVLSQIRQADEIIVSDDNSSDNTLAICEKYADKIKISTNPQGPSGFVNGWNHAIAKATGDYVAILHQDDLLDLYFLSEAEKILKDHPDVLHFFTTCNYIDEERNITGVSYSEKKELVRYSGLEYVKTYQYVGNPHIHRCPGVITHRSIFEKCQYEAAAGHIADDDFFYRVGQYTEVMGLLTPLASYRIHNQSETGKLNNIRLSKRLLDDYIYQVKQWRGKQFLDAEALSYFEYWANKYMKRYFIYSLKRFDIQSIIQFLSLFFRNIHIFIK